MLHELRQFISEKQLFSPNDKILLTVSGGIDSIVLFDLFLKAGFSFAVAHCNFSLRGDESDQDEAFVSHLAQQNSKSFHVKRFDTSTFASSNALSIQMAARQLRYEWFEELALQYGYKYIATAHQLNDIVETMLINLTRGTGIAGLHGILEKNGNIIRPLLFSGRNEIRAYAEKNGLAWREDSSNIEEKYARNLIRHQVIPLLKKLNPNIEEVFSHNAERFKGTELVFKHHIEEYRTKILNPTNDGYSIHVNDIDETPAPLSVLSELLSPFGFNYSTIKTIYAKRFQPSGAFYFSPNYSLCKERSQWNISAIETLSNFEFVVYPSITQIDIPNGTIHFEIIESQNFKGFVRSVNVAYFDYSTIEWPLTLRNWTEGDRFQPFGMQGSKKVSDLFTDLKISNFQKKKIALLVNKDDILWIVGHRASENAKIKESTKKILVCSFSPLMRDTENIN